jgi:FkbM family methyltransferase
MLTGNYEVAERRLLAYMVDAGHICRGDRVLEAGGGLGVLTMKIADVVGDDSIVVFEANPRTAEALQVNLALNRHAIEVESRALVADANADVAFADLIETATGFGSCSTHRVDSGVPTITVPAETLSDVLRRVDPTVLVIDVEGAEHDLLASVRDWRRLRSIHMEVHPEVLSAAKIAAMLGRLAKDGFRVVESPVSDLNVVLLSRSADAAGNVAQCERP